LQIVAGCFEKAREVSMKYHLNSNINEKGDIAGQFIEAIQFAK
jgi:hypothetical protein